MTMASLSADLLVRKGHAEPSLEQATLHTIGTSQVSGRTHKPQMTPDGWLKNFIKRQKTRIQPKGKRIHKSFYLGEKRHHQLRLLAARTGACQQTIMEEALSLFLDEMLEKETCICKGTLQE